MRIIPHYLGSATKGIQLLYDRCAVRDLCRDLRRNNKSMADVMAGRQILVTGARNKWSIAWNAAVSLHREGAKLVFSVFGDREEAGVARLLAEAGIRAP